MPGSSNFKVFDENLQNIQDDATFSADNTRLNGVSAGPASSLLHNKLYRQVSVMVAAIGQFIANQGNVASDADLAALTQAIADSFAGQTDLASVAAAVAAHLADTVPPSPGSTVLTYTGSQLTKVEEKDGTEAIIKTTNLTYDGNGVLTGTTEIVNGKTTTTTLNYTAGSLTSVTRSVA